MEVNIGDKVYKDCGACGEEEIWEVESIDDREYSDGIFKTYHLKAIKHCFSAGVIHSVKDTEQGWRLYRLKSN